jgi:quinol monooxygenase YgiN
VGPDDAADAYATNQEESRKMAFVVAAKWTAKEGEEAAVAAAVEAIAAATAAEPGNLFYQAHRDPEDPSTFFFYEQYVDKAAYEAHGSSTHFKRHGFDDAIPRLAGRERAFYETWED